MHQRAMYKLVPQIAARQEIGVEAKDERIAGDTNESEHDSIEKIENHAPGFLAVPRARTVRFRYRVSAAAKGSAS